MTETRIARTRRAAASWVAIVVALALAALLIYCLVEPIPFHHLPWQ